MNLDKQIKEMAEKEVSALVEAAKKAVTKSTAGTPLTVADVSRLMSGHKTKSTFDICVKKVAERISKDMLASLGNSKEASAS